MVLVTLEQSEEAGVGGDETARDGERPKRDTEDRAGKRQKEKETERGKDRESQREIERGREGSHKGNGWVDPRGGRNPGLEEEGGREGGKDTP